MGIVELSVAKLKPLWFPDIGIESYYWILPASRGNEFLGFPEDVLSFLGANIRFQTSSYSVTESNTRASLTVILVTATPLERPVVVR